MIHAVCVWWWWGGNKLSGPGVTAIGGSYFSDLFMGLEWKNRGVPHNQALNMAVIFDRMAETH